ncbi:OmpA family protein [Phenylobacterium kunshanense]|uniref:OmpA family protein n=1 Tax=Phenylobacterium kunshanense TaxID=1445034 RepID=A0A328BJK4_9CAUL|nr:OmpA family protein [Phenylobacterium kunshanense]RAK67500.1 OmpA family protein [Phenylobacterium kunshanense]
MRVLAFAAAAGLLSGCATSTVTLLNDEAGGPTGAVAVYDQDTGAEQGQLTAANTMARVGGKTVTVRPARGDRYADLMSRMPYPPRAYVLYFYEGTVQITEESKPVLEALRRAVTAETDVQIIGHTDTVGETEFNDKLSYDRAVEVRAALVKDGLPVENSRVVGRGERELRVPTADNVSESGNRRVEVILR